MTNASPENDWNARDLWLTLLFGVTSALTATLGIVSRENGMPSLFWVPQGIAAAIFGFFALNSLVQITRNLLADAFSRGRDMGDLGVNVTPSQNNLSAGDAPGAQTATPMAADQPLAPPSPSRPQQHEGSQ